MSKSFGICFWAGVMVLLLPVTFSFGQGFIIDHTCTDLSQVPSSWIDQAKSNLHIAYQHTSHGSQLSSGMEMINGVFSGGQYAYSNGGGAGLLDYRDYAMQSYAEPPSTYMDLGTPDFTSWVTATRNYLTANPDADVIMWSWCGQVSWMSETQINTYLSQMTTLENEYPTKQFVYMTGHLDGGGSSGTLHQNNNLIRNYCTTNNKILFDFADIERYDPEGVDYLDLGGGENTDGCQYNGGAGNWCSEWCSSHSSPDEVLGLFILRSFFLSQLLAKG